MTVAELVISISILIVVSTTVFPKYTVEEHEINSFIRQLVSDVRYVRKVNTMGDLQTSISFQFDDSKNQHYYILREGGKNKREITLPKDVNLTYSKATIKFMKSGIPNGCAMTIKIINNEDIKEITITPVSGRILFKEGEYEV